MARSGVSCLAVLLVACAAAHAAAPAVPPLDRDQPIYVKARSSDFDYKNNTLVFHGVRIEQGRFAVQADEAMATGLDFNDSHWVFRGGVTITTPDSSLVSDEARVAFAANAVATAQITGTPAAFEQKRDKRVARGHAAHIDYDFAAGTVRLTDDAWLSDGDNEINGRTLLYDMRSQRVRANAEEQGSQRVRITIIPKKPEAKPNP
ncbi:MAG TPA: lipopolysaccharide transport periplasmic protein LptA [Steroidobacteraceae bacterium]|nr:lipopolysaccharide transport periplasmic protein LptA [Steroidobacteraceae bacterium]